MNGSPSNCAKPSLGPTPQVSHPRPGQEVWSLVSSLLEHTGIDPLLTPIRTPQANGTCERFIGSLKWECLDYMLILHGRQLHIVWCGSTLSITTRLDLIRTLNNRSLTGISRVIRSSPQAPSSPHPSRMACTTIFTRRLLALTSSEIIQRRSKPPTIC